MKAISDAVQAAVVIGNLPELPGHNGSVLMIDDTESERCEKAIDSLVAKAYEMKSALEFAKRFENDRGGRWGDLKNIIDAALADA